tara:strand:- start:155 stop:463 length:309 start_codon:yes stop_codon:yes gene_type:complete
MVRFIARLLIVSVLTLNVAWAVDACAFTEPGGDWSLQSEGHPNVPLNADLDCDRWCHAWVNPVALLDASVLDGYTAAAIHDGLYAISYSRLAVPPPFRPPIV